MILEHMTARGCTDTGTVLRGDPGVRVAYQQPRPTEQL
jgi:hypothetical protein